MQLMTQVKKINMVSFCETFEESYFHFDLDPWLWLYAQFPISLVYLM